jgi:hypothetical protein
MYCKYTDFELGGRVDIMSASHSEVLGSNLGTHSDSHDNLSKKKVGL